MKKIIEKILFWVLCLGILTTIGGFGAIINKITNPIKTPTYNITVNFFIAGTCILLYVGYYRVELILVKRREEEQRRKAQIQREHWEAERSREKQIAEEKERVRQQQAEQERKIQQAKAAEREREIAQRDKQEAEARRKKEEEQQRQAQIQAVERARIEREENERIKQQLLQLNLSSRRKDNYKDFAQILEENRISTLYHFTDRANILSIKENGALLSWWYCEQNDITILKPGSDETSKSLDRRYNLQDYVRLSFTPNHPMMYVAKSQGRIQNPIVLRINPEICLFEETKFSDMNATKTGHNCGPTLEDLTRIKFAVVRQNKHFDLSDEDKPYYQAEVLVKTRLPIEWITNINAF